MYESGDQLTVTPFILFFSRITPTASTNLTVFVKANEKEQFGIKIEDKSFAEFQRNIFSRIWELD